jgi:hypothetical protein
VWGTHGKDDKNEYKILIGNPEGKRYLEGLSVNRIILKWILQA